LPTKNQSSGIIRHASSIRFLFPLRKSLKSKPITHTNTHTYTQHTSKKHTQTQSKAKRDKTQSRCNKPAAERGKGRTEVKVGNQVIKRLYILSASQLLCAMARKKTVVKMKFPAHSSDDEEEVKNSALLMMICFFSLQSSPVVLAFTVTPFSCSPSVSMCVKICECVNLSLSL
jgi:hypothetical protein